MRHYWCPTKCHNEYHFRVYRVSIIPNLIRRSSTVNIRLMRTLLLPPLASLSSLPHHPSKPTSSPIQLTDNRNTRREEGNNEVASRNASRTPYLVPVHVSDFFTRSKLGGEPKASPRTQQGEPTLLAIGRGTKKISQAKASPLSHTLLYSLPDHLSNVFH
jgi:hypothetical protein